MEKQEFTTKLGDNIRKIRRDKNLSQRELAILVDKDKQSIQRLEGGRINPSIYYLLEISKGLGVDLEKLIKF